MTAISTTGRLLSDDTVNAVVVLVNVVESKEDVLPGSVVVVLFGSIVVEEADPCTSKLNPRTYALIEKFQDLMDSLVRPVSRNLDCLRVFKRFWYKKGEYKLTRPHGVSFNAFRPGDRWAWLSDHYEYLDQVKEQMKKIRRKTAYTYGGETASDVKEAKKAHFKSK